MRAGARGYVLKNSAGDELVRAIHQGVTYHRMAPPGTTSVEVEVYDVGKSVEGIEVVADIEDRFNVTIPTGHEP